MPYFFFLFLFISNVYAVDIIKANIGESTLDKRISFKYEILKTALDLTKEEFGDYRIEIHDYYMNAKRGFMELETGETINVYFAITQKNGKNKPLLFGFLCDEVL